LIYSVDKLLCCDTQGAVLIQAKSRQQNNVETKCAATKFEHVANDFLVVIVNIFNYLCHRCVEGIILGSVMVTDHCNK
jgi:hypothetical protein